MAAAVVGCQQQQIENVNDRVKEDIMRNMIENEDILEGEEPGASQGSILVHSNSFDDFSAFLDSGDGINAPPPATSAAEGRAYAGFYYFMLRSYLFMDHSFCSVVIIDFIKTALL